MTKKHGGKNLIAGSIHYDETTPHLSIIVKPVHTKENGTTWLSARHYVGGREKLSHLQDDFHERVASRYNLARGTKKSKARHKDIATWYGEQSSGSGNQNITNLTEELKIATEALKTLENEVLVLKQENARWRKEASKTASKWAQNYKDDIKSSSRYPEYLTDLKDDIQDSMVLPRSAKNELLKQISDILGNTPDQTQTRTRGR